jgi:cytochrome b561
MALYFAPSAASPKGIMTMTPTLRYTPFAIFMHWLLALALLGTFTLGLTMADMPGITPTKLKYFNWHKWAGVTIFGLVTLRLLWRLFHPAPPLPKAMAGWEKFVASATHYLLYALMFAIPLSGYFYSLAAGFKVVYLGLIPLPVLIERNRELADQLKFLHYLLNTGLATLVILHALAALKHHFINRDDVLARMLPRSDRTAK